MIGILLSLSLLLAGENRAPVVRAGGWEQRGPNGGPVSQLAVDPSNPLVLYAATQTAGVFKSVDGGESWSQVSSGLPAQVDSLAIDPQHPSTVYFSASGDPAGTHDFVSDNEGLSWTPIAPIAVDSPFGNPRVTALVVDPLSSDTLYAGVTIPGFIPHVPDTGMLFKSTDRGQSWQPVLSIGGEFGGVQQLVVDGGTPQTIYAVANYEIQASLDGGSSWNLRTPAGVGFVGCLVLSPSNASMSLAATLSQGTYKSLDSGMTWTPANDGLIGDALQAYSVVSTGSSTVYLDTKAGVFRSDDFGSSWHLQNSQPQGGLTADPSVPSTVYARDGDFGGISKSTNSGITWRFASEGLVAVETLAIEADSRTPGTVFASAPLGWVFKSIDRGQTWQQRHVGEYGFVVDFSFDPFDVSTIYASSTEGVFESTDGGDQWSLIGSGLAGVNEVLADPTVRGRLFAATQGKLFRTDDGGSDWIPTGPVESTDGNGHIAFDPESHVLYFGAGEGLFRSADSGSTWERTSVTGEILALEVTTGSPAVAYASSLDGFFRSTDASLSWQPITSLPSAPTRTLVFAIAINPVRPSEIYVTLTYPLGVYRSPDGGEHWLPFNDGLVIDPLISFGVGRLSVDAAGDRLYGSGVGVLTRPIAPRATRRVAR
jgi:photosystem II stability/assembly factor-like uncharacterized protein